MQSSSSSDFGDQQSSEVKRGFFAKICHFITSGTEKVGDIGEHLITSAQKDLYNLKDELINSWVITPQERDTLALYIAAVLSRIFGAAFILGSTLILSPLKIVAGAVFMILGFRVITLCKRLINTLWEVFKESWQLTCNFVKNVCNNIYELIARAVNESCALTARFFAAVLRNIIWACEKLSLCVNKLCSCLEQVLNTIWNVLKDIGTCIYNLLDNVFHLVSHVVQGGFSLVGGCVNGVVIAATAVVMGVGALFFETGASNVVAGVTKLVFAVNEGIATCIGSVLDGVYDCGDKLITGVRSLFGYRVPVANQQELHTRQPLLDASNSEHDVERNLPALPAVPVIVAPQRGIFFVGPVELQSKYFRESIHGVARELNDSVSSMGTSIEKGYYAGKGHLFGNQDQHDAEVQQPDVYAPLLNLA